MKMSQRLEQLLLLKKMCVTELKQAQANCDRYSSNMSTLTENLNENWEGSNCFFAEYESLITDVTNIMDATRKFNLNLHINIIKISEYGALSTRKEQKKLKNVSESSETPKESKNDFIPAEEYDLNSEDTADFLYPAINLKEVYKADDVINGIVTYIKNLKDLRFYIFDYSSEYRMAVVDISKSLELRQYHDMPSQGDVFGCVLDNQIFRAVLGNKTFHDVEMNEDIVPCYLLDTGEVVVLKSDQIMYKLREDQKRFPALALPCQLINTNKNPFMTETTMENTLKEIEYKKCHLKILAIDNDTLQVRIMDDTNVKAPEEDLRSKSVENVPLDTNLSKPDRRQLTQEELSMIYEEPLSTSNVMKAVMGYDPQDDKRLCRFYNPATGGCFKGVKCKLEHTLRQPEGWTKDILPTSSIIDIQQPITIFTPGSIINITPTYVGKLDRFFAQINDLSKNTSPLVWNDEDIPSWKRLVKPPHMFEMILSCYIDGLWYRGKIMSHDDDYKMFKVFYVDYGNTQMVHLSNLASIDVGISKLPWQAVMCRFENVNEKTISEEERQNCIEILCEIILNKSMDVKVISHYEDLFISFEDKESYPLPDVLIEMGYLEMNKNKLMHCITHPYAHSVDIM